MPNFSSLSDFLFYLERNGELKRFSVEVDPVLETTEISMRALKEGKQAILFERCTNAKFPLAMNMFASEKRIELALGKHPEQLGEELIRFLEEMMPPTLDALLNNKPIAKRFLSARPKKVSSGVSQEIISQPMLSDFPIQKCWEFDGGRFITYGQVFTYDPRNAKRNVGIYRMHVFDDATTGMHWQIQKGGGFHYYQAQKLKKDFPLAVALGTEPAMLLATIAALPEGIDEVMFAGFLRNARFPMTKAKSIPIDVPANAEFILEGFVPLDETRLEGPFGDHFGHYSNAANFPVFNIKTITHKRNAIYPGIVVGKPPMEDKFLGDATQQILAPLIKLIHKEITAMWAYYEAGFHNLLVVAVDQRYQKEAMKAALGIMGTDQLALTKCIITVSENVDVKNWNAVLREIKNNFDPHFDFVMIPKVPLDTLDFSSYKMNLGSKMIVDATRKVGGLRLAVGEKKDLRFEISDLRLIDSRILQVNLVDETLLLVKVDTKIDFQFVNHKPQTTNLEPTIGKEILEKIIRLPELQQLKLIAMVSEDVDIFDKESYIWGVFTRFDCERDVIFSEQKLIGISPVYNGVMGIDATWKIGYPAPLIMNEEIVKRVDAKWGRMWK
ncbi:MAG: UbiD family decarboxylase [Ignavibacteriales bacterium]|nr:UbiD family decarboxylase [Ignavibacteriales bacterium]